MTAFGHCPKALSALVDFHHPIWRAVRKAFLDKLRASAISEVPLNTRHSARSDWIRHRATNCNADLGSAVTTLCFEALHPQFAPAAHTGHRSLDRTS